MKNPLICLSLFLLLSAGSAFAADDADFEDFDDMFDEGGETIVDSAFIPDPLEGFNRAMFGVNDKLYFYMMKPVSQGYGFVLPRYSRVCVRNFFHNIEMPRRFINCLLQGKLEGAGTELTRFTVNSIFGLGGLFDIARMSDVMPQEEDTGQTFGVWGMGPGFYLTLPLVGPTSGRDGLGSLFDLAMSPTIIIPGSSMLQRVNNTSLRIGQYEAMKNAAVDPYISLRNYFSQYREKAIQE